MPLYLVMLVIMFFQRYLYSLTGLFIGEVLGIFSGDKSILPSIISRFVVSDSIKSKITSISIIYIIVTALTVVGNMLTKTIKAIHYEKLYLDLSKEFYKHVLDIPKSEYANRSTGDIIQRNIEDCKRIPGLFKNSLYELFRIVFTTITMLYQLFKLSGIIFSVSLVALIICISFSGYYGYFKIKKKEIESSKYYSELNSTIQQSITNYSLVKSFANDEYEFDKFNEMDQFPERHILLNSHRKKETI